jgi:hypothetical protein
VSATRNADATITPRYSLQEPKLIHRDVSYFTPLFPEREDSFISLMVGLAATAALGLIMVGALNLISIAFAVLFIGWASTSASSSLYVIAPSVTRRTTSPPLSTTPVPTSARN